MNCILNYLKNLSTGIIKPINEELINNQSLAALTEYEKFIEIEQEKLK